jgi:hypothetical protein
MAFLRHDPINRMARKGVQVNASLCGLLGVYSADKQAVSLEAMKINEEAVRRHIMGEESPSHSTCQVSQGFFHLATSSDGIPAATVAFRKSWVSQGTNLGISLLHK